MQLFILESYGGEYEDKWQDTIGVFATKQLAEDAQIVYETKRVDSLNEWEKENREYWKVFYEIYELELNKIKNDG